MTKRVVKDVKSFMLSSKELMAVFSNFPIENDEITLEDNSKDLYFLVTSNDENIVNYIADFDVSNDSDLN
ncbi:MAG: hypothetical protein LBQ24_06105 [Candidatus Peribacteria bacterium]|nr:hypothetical protein [Candidatus Peribacteria bacterium]